MVSSAAFKRFMDKAGAEHPYCNLRTTRSNYYCKWLLLKASKPATKSSRSGVYTVLQSSSLPKKIERDMIRSGTAFPLPPFYDGIIDCVESWGKDMHKGWEQAVYEYLYETIHDGETKYQVYYSCLLLLVSLKLSLYSTSTSEGIMNAWVDYYGSTFTNITEDFEELTVNSINYVEWLIGIPQSQQADVNTALNTPQLETPLSYPHVVPLSPVSSGGFSPIETDSMMESA